MKLKLFLTVLIMGVFISPNSQAAIYLEPYLGYQSGKLTGSFDFESDLGDGELDVESDTSGYLTGLRLGLGFEMGLSFGGDFQYAFDSDGSAITSYGPFVGFDLPIPVRFYGTYFLSSSAGVVDDGEFEMTGSGYRVGVGFTFIPVVSINVEYESLAFDSFEFSKGGSGVNSIDNVSINNDSVNIVLSVPLMI